MLDIPVFVWVIALVAVFILIFGRKPLRPFDFGQANETAARTLLHLHEELIDFNKESQSYLEHYLEELESLFSMLVRDYPDHALTSRIRWIITENMVTEFPLFKLMQPEHVDDRLQIYRDQLQNIQFHLSKQDFDGATKAATQGFNWEQRDYATL